MQHDKFNTLTVYHIELVDSTQKQISNLELVIKKYFHNIDVVGYHLCAYLKQIEAKDELLNTPYFTIHQACVCQNKSFKTVT